MNELANTVNCPSDVAAKRLLGCYLTRTINNQTIVCKIVETEAYDQSDPASHSFRGKTPRNSIMFGPPGYLYVYFTYGMHYCMNIVVGPEGHGSAVLIRAVEPISGIKLIHANRRDILARQMLTNGPAKTCQALAIDQELNSHDLIKKPLKLTLKEPVKDNHIASSRRIGISAAKDVKWRFYIKGNSYVSKTPRRSL